MFIPLSPTITPEKVVEEKLRYAQLTPFTDIKEEEISWLWRPPEGRIIPAGTVITIAGNGGAGKSTFLAWIAAHLTQGTLEGDYKGTPAKVFWISGEDDAGQVLKPRFRAADGDSSLIFNFTMCSKEGQEITPVFSRDVEDLAEQIMIHSPRLVVIDPVTSFFGGSDLYKSTDVRDNFFTPLSLVAAETDCTIVLVTHLNKSGEGNSVAKVLGSEAFTNAPRAVINFKADEDNPGYGVFTLVKFNLGSERGLSYNYQIQACEIEADNRTISTSKFVLGGQSEKTIDDLFSDEADRVQPSVLSDAIEFITQLLEYKGGAMYRADVIRAAKKEGISERTCVRAREKATNPWIITSRERKAAPKTLWQLDTRPPENRENIQTDFNENEEEFLSP